MCASSGILFMLGFHLSWGLNVCCKYFNTALVRIRLSSSIGPWIVELSGPFHGDPSTYSFILFSCPLTPWVHHLRADGPVGWWFKVQEMTVQSLGDDGSKSRRWRFWYRPVNCIHPWQDVRNHLWCMTRVILSLDIISNWSVSSASVHVLYKYHTPPFSFLYFLLKTYCQRPLRSVAVSVINALPPFTNYFSK